jgi:multiple sugar transport system permease protein
VRNVATYTAVVVPVQTFVALVMAAVLDQKLPFRRFFRIAWYLPCVASSVVTTLIFMWLFLPDGFINAALNFIGLNVRINWLGDEATALPSIMFMNIWATAATMMLIFLAAIQDIPGPIYEAAHLDGAGPIRQFFQITIPLLRPAIFLVVLLGTIGCFQLYDQVKIATNGGPNEATLTVTYLLWKEGFRDLNMGYASALGVILSAGIFAISLVAAPLPRRATGLLMATRTAAVSTVSVQQPSIHVPDRPHHLPRCRGAVHDPRAHAVRAHRLGIVQDKERDPRLAPDDHPAGLPVAELRRGVDQLALLPAVDPQ